MNTKKSKAQKAAASDLHETSITEAATATPNNLESPANVLTGQGMELKAESSQATEVVDPAETREPKKRKTTKTKVIRDSFSFPEQDYRKISELKKTCLAAGVQVKKGEILRAGLNLLTKLNLSELTQVIEQIEKVKTGRPNSAKI